MSSRRRLTASDLGEPHERLDWMIEALFAALLIFCPFGFGATEAWSQFIAYALLSAIGLVTGLKLVVDRSAAFVWSWAYVPVALFLLIPTLQIIPLPAHVVARISPTAVATRAELLGPAAGQAAQTISLYPFATARDLCLLVSVVVVFICALQFYRTTERIVRLLLTVTVIGLAIGLLATYQNLTSATTVYGIVPMMHRNSGPFMNYGHYGQFMNLSIGAAVGLLLMTIRTGARAATHGTLRTGILALAHHRSLIVLCATTIVLGASTIALSLTRMGALSGLIAGGTIAVLYSWRSKQRGSGTLVVVAVMIVLGGLLYAGFDVAFERLATLRDFDRAGGGRNQLFADILPLSAQYRIVGTGLGSYEYVFPGYDRTASPALAAHAENEYTEMLGETGSAGIVCILGFLLVIAGVFTKRLWRPQRLTHFGAFGIAYGLLAVVLHSGSDFGQHVPAIAYLTACFFAVALQVGRFAQRPKEDERQELVTRRGRRFLPARVGGLAAFLAMVVAGLTFAYRAWAGESEWNAATRIAAGLETEGWTGSDDDFRRLLTAAASATAWQPGNVKYAYGLSSYRWRSLARSDSASPERCEFASRVADDLLAARVLCPTFGPLYSLAGQIQYFELGRPEGAGLVRTGARLSPQDKTSAFASACIELMEGRPAPAREMFSRAAAMGAPSGDIIDAWLGVGMPEQAYSFAAGDRRALELLASRLPPSEAELITRSRKEALLLLSSESAGADASADVVAHAAEAYATLGDRAAAIDLYRRALPKDYSRWDWHLRLAQLLYAEGKLTEALDEAKISRRLQPSSTEAANLIRELTGKTGA